MPFEIPQIILSRLLLTVQKGKQVIHRFYVILTNFLQIPWIPQDFSDAIKCFCILGTKLTLIAFLSVISFERRNKTHFSNKQLQQSRRFYHSFFLFQFRLCSTLLCSKSCLRGKKKYPLCIKPIIYCQHNGYFNNLMQEALLIPGQIVIEKEIILLYRKKKKKKSQ